MRRAARRDENEPDIIKALRQVGACVYPMDEPCDLLVGFRNQTILMEIKNPKNNYGKKGFNKNQREFFESWRGGIYFAVDSVDAALRVLNVIKEIK